jgi:hypothetical protein
MRFLLAFTALVFAFTLPASAKVDVKKVDYGGWPNCIKMTNGKIELVATTDVGPRILRFGFVGGDNEFCEFKGDLGQPGGDAWRSYGGHRFWHSPESHPRTYYPDNFPVKYEINGNTMKLTADVEKTNGMQKEIRITMDPDSNHVQVVHTMTNHSTWPVKLAPWALTVMNLNGKAILPLEPYSPHPGFPDQPGQVIDQKNYLPVGNLVLWSFTKLNDPRWVFTSKYVILKQDPTKDRPQKIGMSSRQNWMAYARNNHLFVKKVAYQPGAEYPDNGCIFEVFSCAGMLELETLGPLKILDPGANTTHTEDWYLFDGVKAEDTDESIDANVLPKVKGLRT